MTELLQTYVSAWPGIWLMDTGRYLLAATAMTAILALFWRAGLSRRKLQPRRATALDIRREILASLRSALVFSLLGTVVFVAARRGWVTLHQGFDQAGPLYFVLSLAFMLVAHDTYFYWTHRAMHHRRLFALFHRTHHLSRTPTPWAAYSFSVPEAVVQGAFVPIYLALVPMHALAVFLFVAVQIVRNVMGHAGSEVHPSSFGPGRWLGWNNTTTHHDLHHETGRYNYGLYFRWWDKLMGTEHPDYRRKFETIVAPGTGVSQGVTKGAATATMLLLLAIVQPMPADAADNGVIGRWATPGASAVVELARCADAATICGTIRWLWDATDEGGRSRLDAQNTDASLRMRPLLGLTILSGLAARPDGGWEGRIYNPEDGQTYRASVSRRGADSLVVEGCVLFVCRKQLWRRTSTLAEAFK